MREQDIQREIQCYLDVSRVLWWRCSLGGMRVAGGVRARNPMRGFPDLAGIVPGGLGRLFVVEVKAEKGRLKPEQQMWRERLEASGVHYILARRVEDVSIELAAFAEVGS